MELHGEPALLSYSVVEKSLSVSLLIALKPSSLRGIVRLLLLWCWLLL